MNNLGKVLKGALLEVEVLSLLDEKPRHGYALIAAIKNRFRVNLSASTVYPLLYNLEQDNYIKAEWNTNRRPQKIYELTPKGKTFLATSTQDIKMIIAPLLIAQ